MFKKEKEIAPEGYVTDRLPTKITLWYTIFSLLYFINH